MVGEAAGGEATSNMGNRGQTGLPANFRQRAPEIHVRLVSPRRRLLQQDGDGGGGEVEAVDAAAEFEGPADDGVGVHGDEEILNQEVEGGAVDDEAGDLHTLDIDGGAAGGGADAGGDGDGALAVEELGHEPAGLAAGGTFQLAEIDERGASGEVAGGDAQLGIAHAGGRFPGDPGVEFREGEDDARAGAQAAGFDGVELLFGGGVIVVCGAGEGCGDKQDRDGPQSAAHDGLDAGGMVRVAGDSAKGLTHCGKGHNVDVGGERAQAGDPRVWV